MKYPALGVVLMSVALMTGCGEEPAAAPAPTTPAPTSTTPAVPTQTELDAKAKDAAAAAAKTRAEESARLQEENAILQQKKALLEAKLKAETEALADAKAEKEAAAAEKTRLENLKTSTTTAANGLVDATTSNAQNLLTQFTTYIKDNKMDLAEKALVQLENMKGSLPESYQAQIDNARTLFNTKDAASNFFK